MSDLQDELLSELSGYRPRKKRLQRSHIITTAILLMFGWYVGVLLFGNSSVFMLSTLNSELETLQNETNKLKQTNANIQKKLFEIKEIRSSH